MRRLRFITGVVLVLGGPSAGILVLRAAVGDRARAQAALVAAADREAEARHAEERRAVETQVSAAATLEPLAAGLRARVDGATLVDMFENEDWWRPYRQAFPLVRVLADGKPLATRGPAVSAAEAELVARARAQGLASGIVRLDSGAYVAAAVRVPGAVEREPFLVLGRPLAAEAPPPPPTVAPSPLADRTVVWPVVGVVCLGGLGLVLSGRRRGAGAGAIPVAPLHEITSRFGTPANPRAVPATPARGPITDGHAMRIPSAPGVAAAAAVATRPSADPGSLFGRYRLLGRLGEGGMSELFVAEATGVEGFSRTFVLKRLRHELAHHKEAVAQFIDEARMQAGLVHSNIVPVFDFGVVGGEYFMTQEYIVGRDLGRLLPRVVAATGAGLPESVAYYIAYETLQALSFAHERRDKSGAAMNIVHRDVSAGNVMVSLLGEVKLADFGIVKASRRVTQTQVGMVKGNANFMSPEQARGQAVDRRSDLFSLAHVLHYALTGRLLYSGENDLDVLYRAANGLTEQDLQYLAKFPEPARGVLTKALAFDPAERFQSATEFADALAAHIGGGKSETARLMRSLFGPELEREVTGQSAAVVGGHA
ncbi:MAG TPA: serine/threonine-protein kinase [Polyangia bacterium]|nr:serine/threonine-protein kinase [Polyangia bacterium]